MRIRLELERPSCPVCGATLTGRQYFRRTPDGMVMYENGETIDHDNIIEVHICPRCDRS